MLKHSEEPLAHRAIRQASVLRGSWTNLSLVVSLVRDHANSSDECAGARDSPPGCNRRAAHPLILHDCRAIRILMIKSSRKINSMHMTRFGWAVEGVVR